MWKDSRTYCGDYDNDLRHGRGVIFYAMDKPRDPSKLHKIRKRWMMGCYFQGQPFGPFLVVREGGMPWVEVYSKDGKRRKHKRVWCFDDKLDLIRKRHHFCDVLIYV